MLRRYWHPIVVARELTPESPTKFARILGEDLVLFLDRGGHVGLIADRCSHRGASLLYGRVEERGIACAYHGWLYDTTGRILETPPERNDAIMNSVRQKAYPVHKFVGLYFTYMGPQPVPEFPKYDLLVRKDGVRKIVVHPQLDANWLQAMENSVDPAHLEILHQELIGRGRTPVSTTRGFTDDVESFEFYLTSYGIIKKRLYVNGLMDEHPLIFPNILRQGSGLQYRVPIDDTHTAHIHVRFEQNEDGSLVEEEYEPEVEYVAPYKDPVDARHPFTRMRLDAVIAQDHMAWETQGPIADRTVEHLSYSDRGVILLRRVVKENIERVQRGEDPLGVVREPHDIIDTKLSDTLEAEKVSREPTAAVAGAAKTWR
jgi:5,5'-dehydrodivanillate O-demethylase